MSTPHIAAEPGDFAPAVLFPGDPRRAERIARSLMPDARLVTDVRGMLGFTGTVAGKPLSVMGSGMGMPSATIYATELFDVFGVERIIRVGTTGGISRAVRAGDVIIGVGAHTNSSMNEARLPGIHFSAVASFPLVRAAVEAAGDDPNVQLGMLYSNDHFYLSPDDPEHLERLAKYGVLGVEMEAAALFAVAAEFGREAAAIVTVSDHLLDHSEDMTPEERESNFDRALRLAVAAALS